MLHFPSAHQVPVSRAVVVAFRAELVPDGPDFGLLEHLGRQSIGHFAGLGLLAAKGLAVDAEALFDGVPVDDWSVGGKEVHALVN
jgi:hypothetical protein